VRASSITVPVLSELMVAEHSTVVVPTPVRYWALVPGATLLQALPTGDVDCSG